MMRSFSASLAVAAVAGLLPLAHGAGNGNTAVHPKATPHATPKLRATGTPSPVSAADKETPTTGTSKVTSTDSTGVPVGTPLPKPETIRMIICGDSTAALFDPAQEYQGWGYYLQDHFRPDAVQVVDLAKKGRTARGYIDQGFWKETLKMQPRIVLIQFGQNELLSLLDHPEDQVAQLREYRKYMAAMIDTARKAGVLPIILTPTHNASFDQSGKPADNLVPFVEASKDLAEARGVPMIDVYTAMERLYQALGPDKVRLMQGRPEDPVHFGPLGSWTVAAIVAKELKLVEKRLFVSAKDPSPAPFGQRSASNP